MHKNDSRELWHPELEIVFLLRGTGRICFSDLKTTYTLREKDIFDLTTVKYAILETNGQLSTLLYAKALPASAKDAGVKVKDTELPITLVSGGKLLEKNLALSGMSRSRLDEGLRQHGATVESTLLATVDKAGKLYLVRREDVR